MPVPLPILEAKLNEARSYYPYMERSMRLRGGILQHGLRKNPAAPCGDDYTYRYKRSVWRCHVRVTASEMRTHAMLWWQHGTKKYPDTALDAIVLRGSDMPLHFDSHFFSRWGLRSDLMGVMLTNMMGFFKQYPQLAMRQSKPFYDKQPEFAAALAQGMVFGRRNGKRIISCDTFKSLEMLSPEERILWERLAPRTTGPVAGEGNG